MLFCYYLLTAMTGHPCGREFSGLSAVNTSYVNYSRPVDRKGARVLLRRPRPLFFILCPPPRYTPHSAAANPREEPHHTKEHDM